MKPYNKSNIPLAKNLRKNQTPWGRKLWYDYLRYYPVRFQRQKAIGNYIVDFYCAKAHLVIELDGGGHYEPAQEHHDALRTQFLQNMNLAVLRICNRDIDKNFVGICEYIDHAVKEALPQSALLTAPSTEGALDPKTIYALGFFDGVHLGHQALLRACKALAAEHGCRAGAVTFTTHPDMLVSGKAPVLLNTIEDRKKLLCFYGAEVVRELPFDQRLMNTHWSDFLRALVENGAAGFVCGSDFRFGAGGNGTAKKLEAFCKKQNLPCAIVPQQELEGIRISSTAIRQLLAEGDVEKANRLLGHRHMLSGTVVPGRQLGRTIGIPTANLELPPEIIVPKFGVYATAVSVDGKSYAAVTNIGTRPTVKGENVTVEPWILDFAGDLYGKELTLTLHAYLREEQKFASLEDLQAEIRKNAAQTREILKKI